MATGQHSWIAEFAGTDTVERNPDVSPAKRGHRLDDERLAIRRAATLVVQPAATQGALGESVGRVHGVLAEPAGNQFRDLFVDAQPVQIR